MPKQKHTLNDIIKKFQDIESLILESEGMISDEIEAKLIDNETDLSKKLDGYEKFSRYLKGQIEYLKSTEEQYAKRRKTIENSIKRIRERMLNAMLVLGKSKVKTLEYNFSIGETEKWNIDLDKIGESVKDDLVNQGLADNIFKPNLTQIKNEYKEDIPNWVRVEKNKHLRVK